MAVTAGGTPYVEASDLVASYPATSLALANKVDTKLDNAPTNNAQSGATYTFVLADARQLVSATSASAKTFTIPPQTSVVWLTGTIIRVVNFGAGALTVAAGAGVTLTNSATTIAVNASAEIIRTASNTWTLVPNGSASGLTLITPTTIANSGGSASVSGGAVTFTGVTSVSLNGVFSAAYDTYEINFRVNDYVASQQLRYRFRLSGTDNTASNYTIKGAGGGASTVNVNLDNQNIGQLTNNDGPGFYSFRIDSPAVAIATRSISHGMNDNDGRVIVMGHLHTAATAFDGISFIASTGSMTGKIRIFGYQNS